MVRVGEELGDVEDLGSLDDAFDLGYQQVLNISFPD